MPVSRWIFTGIALLFFSGACGSSQEKAIPDDHIGLVDADIRDTPVPRAFADNSTEPGETPVLAPAYAGSPPVIPHGIADFLETVLQEHFGAAWEACTPAGRKAAAAAAAAKADAAEHAAAQAEGEAADEAHPTTAEQAAAKRRQAEQERHHADNLKAAAKGK